VVDAVFKRWRDRGLVAVGIGMDTAEQGDPAEYAARHGLTYPIAWDAAGEVSRRYEVDSLPTLVVVSRTGKVVAVRVGTTSAEELEPLIRAAL
jgi:peroxiredoxin